MAAKRSEKKVPTTVEAEAEVEIGTMVVKFPLDLENHRLLRRASGDVDLSMSDFARKALIDALIAWKRRKGIE